MLYRGCVDLLSRSEFHQQRVRDFLAQAVMAFALELKDESFCPGCAGVCTCELYTHRFLSTACGFMTVGQEVESFIRLSEGAWEAI